MTTDHGSEDRGAGPTAADAFAVLWDELVTVLGTVATATLIRRAAKRTPAFASELSGLNVSREGWEYRYELPASWRKRGPAEAQDFATLVRAALVPLLWDLTGPVVVRRLARAPALAPLELADLEEAQ